MLTEQKDQTQKKTEQVAWVIQPQAASNAVSSKTYIQVSFKAAENSVQPYRLFQAGLQLSPARSYHTETGQQMMQGTFVGLSSYARVLRIPRKTSPPDSRK